MNVSILKFDIVPSNVQKPLGIEIWINDQCLLDKNHLDESQQIIYNFDDEFEQSYDVKITLKNKTAQHTQVNEKLEIISDSLIEVKNFTLDDIDIDQVVREQAVYSHNFNSDGKFSDHKFYNTLGCNGTVKFKISTPSYLWLLEHM